MGKKSPETTRLIQHGEHKVYSDPESDDDRQSALSHADESVLSDARSQRTDPVAGFDDANYAVYGFRWVILLIYSLVILGNAASWLTYSQISDEAGAFYGTSQTYIDLMSTLFMMWYIVINFPASWVIENWGFRPGVLLGGGLTVVGCWIRCAGRGESTFFIVIIGQSLTAIGQPFLLNAPTTLSVRWFPEKERALATTLGVASQLIGAAIGFVVPPMFVSNTNLDGVNTVNIVMAVLSTVPFFFAVAFLKDKPETPPSPVGSTEVYEHDTWRDIKRMLTSPSFMGLFASFGVGMGAFNTIATLLNQVVKPFGYGNTQSSVFGAMNIIFGLIGSGVAGVLMDTTHRFKAIYVAWLIIGSASMILFWALLDQHVTFLLYVACAIAGFFIVPAIPVAMEFGAEIMYPMEETQTTGMLVLSGQIVGIGCVFGFQQLIDDDQQRLVAALVAAMLALSAFLAIFIGGLKAPAYKRRMFELAGKREEAQDAESRQAE
ncbi:putative MFS-type transporter C09D4.1 [Diplonema papillatum]|nr:putative MFS-type transporter C09D4.1 [Diplonema papillatum]